MSLLVKEVVSKYIEENECAYACEENDASKQMCIYIEENECANTKKKMNDMADKQNNK